MSREGSWLLRVASRVLRAVEALGDEGRRVARGRPPGYRPWDPDVLEVDLAAEREVLRALEELGEPAVVLSEEAGRIPAGEGPQEPPAGGDGKLRVVVDPFDGSLLYRRGLPFLWGFGAGIWRGERHRASCVADLLGKTAWLADGAVLVEVGPDGRMRPLPAEGAGGPPRLEEAYVATYLMKPHYLAMALPDFQRVLRASRFVVPIGGPLAWAFLAAGRIDAYLAHHQPLTEVYSGIGLALTAGCLVTDLDGRPPRLVEDVAARYTLVASRHPDLHARILREVVRSGAGGEACAGPVGEAMR